MAKRIYPKRKPRFTMRQWREYRGLTETQLGAALKVSAVAIGAWENWDTKRGRRPDLPTLAAIAEALEINIGDLFHSPPGIPDPQASINNLLRDQPEEVLDQVRRIIEAIKGQ